MNTHQIYKYQLGFDSVLELPSESKVLSVQVQAGVPCLWVHFSLAGGPLERRRFSFFATGSACPATGYLGTIQMDSLVWHLFEVAA